jgi:RecJ-like exonuclease
MSIGEVRDCAHCQGTGFCNNGGVPCIQCYRAGDYAGSRDRWTQITCSVCEGKGSVWVGPKTIYIREDD